MVKNKLLSSGDLSFTARPYNNTITCIFYCERLRARSEVRVSLSRVRKIFGSAKLAIFFHANYFNSIARVISQVVANKGRLAYFEITVIYLFDFCALCCVIISQKGFPRSVAFNNKSPRVSTAPGRRLSYHTRSRESPGSHADGVCNRNS